MVHGGSTAGIMRRLRHGVAAPGGAGSRYAGTANSFRADCFDYAAAFSIASFSSAASTVATSMPTCPNSVALMER
jgi:hypothetical protein